MHLHGEAMSIKEHWLPIPEFPGYEVSDQGRVQSYWHQQGQHPYIISKTPQRTLKLFKSPKGYLMVRLSRNGRQYRRRIHQFVMLTFIGPYPPNMEISHLDEIKTNNKLSNLTYEPHIVNCRRPKIRERASRSRHGRQCNQLIGTSKFRGVHQHGKRWRATIVYLKQKFRLGMFDTPHEAAITYDTKALELYGDNAITNQSLGLLKNNALS